jgi:hypothetical protein
MKRRFLLLLTVTLLVTFLYAIAAPTGSGGGYRFIPRYAMELEDRRIQKLYEGGELPESLAVRSSDYLAYLDLRQEGIRSVHRRAFGMAVTPWGFANYGEAPSGVIVQSPDGRPLFSLSDPGYPLGRGGALFHLHANGYGVSEYNREGEVVSSFGGISPISAFDAIQGRRVIGFLSGALFHRFYPPAEETGDETPWIRVPLPPAETEIVYDVAFSPEGEALLVRSGLEPQSVSFFDLQQGLQEPFWVYEPAVSSMRPEALALLTSRQVVVEVAQELHLLSRESGTLLDRIEDAELGEVVEFREAGLSLYTLFRDGGSREELRLLETPGKELFVAGSVEKNLRLQREGNLLIVARGSRVGLVEVYRE